MKTKYFAPSSPVSLLFALFVACACLLLLKERRPRQPAPVFLSRPKLNIVMDPVVRYAPLQSGAFLL